MNPKPGCSLRLLAKPALAAVACLLLASCGTQPSRTPQTFQPATQSIERTPEELLAEAMSAHTPQLAAQLQIQAGESYYRSQLYAQARAAIVELREANIAAADLDRYYHLQLLLALETRDPAGLESLHQRGAFDFLTSQALPPAQQTQRILQVAEAMQVLGRSLEQALLLAEHYDLFAAAGQQEIIEAIWSGFRDTPTNELVLHSYYGANADIHAWLELARNFILLQSSLEKQYTALKEWQAAWPEHPAVLSPPRELAVLDSLPQTRPTKVILALPLSGSLSGVGHAIRNGFLAAMYAERENDAGLPDVHFFDTARDAIEALYTEHDASPNTLVIGPLEKGSLIRLAAMDSLPLKTLALNYLPDDAGSSDNMIQFGLSPEQEAEQIASDLSAEGVDRVVLMAPETELGIRIHDAFVSSFINQGGTLLDSVFFKNQTDLSEATATLLGTAKSNRRFSRLRQLTELPLTFEPRRRFDLDAIVMTATPSHAKQLNPLFAFNFAGDVPVYATSLVHDPRTPEHRDLNGVRFIQMPWLLSQSNQLRLMLRDNLELESDHYSQFHALGVDAFQLMPRLSLLEQIQGSRIEGQTGTLGIEGGKVIRTMQWAEFRGGVAVASTRKTP
jgi:outer membrane PBP1 activator LpoA protein